MSYDSSTLVSASSTPLGQHGSGSRGVKWLVQYRYAAAKPGFGAVPSPPLTIKPERNRSYYKLVFELNGVLSRYALRLEAGKARMKESALVDFALNLTRASTWAAGICRGNYATDTAPLGSWLTYPCTQASDSGASRALGSEQRKPELKKRKAVEDVYQITMPLLPHLCDPKTIDGVTDAFKKRVLIPALHLRGEASSINEGNAS
jgi:hypothetical protein